MPGLTSEKFSHNLKNQRKQDKNLNIPPYEATVLIFQLKK